MIDIKNPSTLTKLTLSHYDTNPQGFWEGTKNHDVTQNYENFLKHISGKAPFKLLDFGCGPGRDLKYFSDLGHIAFGLDGCEAFCKMAQSYSNCEVLHQDFIDLNLKENFFHGVFANASLFHVPKSELAQTLTQIRNALIEKGILFSSNPRGQGEDCSGSRYGNFMELEEYKAIVENVGFKLLDHYYRPTHMPLEQRPWLACVFVKD